MESRIDHLELASGGKLSMPFEIFLVFSTNLKPAQLGDEAFLRRIKYKMFVKNPRKCHEVVAKLVPSMPDLKIKACFIDPMLLHLTGKLPEGGSWAYELKAGWFRSEAIKSRGRVHLRSRNDKDTGRIF